MGPTQSAGPPLTVTGAGTPGVDGFYRCHKASQGLPPGRTFTKEEWEEFSKGRPWYRNVNGFTISSDTKRWYCCADHARPRTYYKVASEADTPPTEGWVDRKSQPKDGKHAWDTTLLGDAPAPTFQWNAPELPELSCSRTPTVKSCSQKDVENCG